MALILVVDDERSMREFLQILLEGESHEVISAERVQEALELSRERRPALIFADLRLPDGSGMDILRESQNLDPEVQVIMMTAFATTQNAVDAMRMGAYDYQIKPFKVDEVKALTAKALEKHDLLVENRLLKAQLESHESLARIVGRSPKMIELKSMIQRVALSRTNVLIEGESGTGKELVARAIHETSPRASQPFVAVNCGAIPENLIESELFGHSAGAFTGANRARPGIFRSADGGTLFLDEITELPVALQVKLLRALEERKVRPVGEEVEHAVDVRILASTNRDLQFLVTEGEFRQDLFYRLNVVRIRVPALRERIEDVPLLARAFALRYADEAGKEFDGIEPEAIRALATHPYPGNVRELENFIERAVALALGSTICLEDLPEEVSPSVKREHDLLAFPEEGINLENTLRAIESQFVSTALNRAAGVKTRAAELLGLSFRSFRYRVEKLDRDELETAENEGSVK